MASMVKRNKVMKINEGNPQVGIRRRRAPRMFVNLNLMVVSYSPSFGGEKSSTGPGGGLKNSTGPSIISPSKTLSHPESAIPLIAIRPGLGLKTTMQLVKAACFAGS